MSWRLCSNTRGSFGSSAPDAPWAHQGDGRQPHALARQGGRTHAGRPRRRVLSGRMPTRHPADRAPGLAARESTVAAQITCGTRPAELYAAILAEVPTPRPAQAGVADRPARALSGPGYLEWSNAVIGSAADAAEMRRLMGAAARERDASDGADSARWRETVAARLPCRDWPRQRVLIPAVDADTGEPVVLDRHSGVDLVDAVAASTSAMTPYRVGGRRYLNGGYRRSENADLAAGYGRVLVLSPFGGRSRMPAGWGMDLATQVEDLRGGGSRVETVFPDARSGEVFDANALDPSTRLPAARGGHEQGLTLSSQLADFWH